MKNITTLISAYLDDTLSDAEARTLREWIDADPENRRIFIDNLRMSRLQQMVIAAERRTPRRKMLRRTIAAAAACAALVVAVVGVRHSISSGERFSSLIPQADNKIVLVTGSGESFEIGETTTVESIIAAAALEPASYNTIKVPFGQRHEFTLSDGSTVRLNSNTEFRFPSDFAGADRRQVFLRGEGFFEVQPDPDKPFVITSDGVDVRVLGTRFNVAAYDYQMATTLVSGAVEVTAGDRITRLAPGNQMVYDRSNGETSVRGVDVSLYTSWVDGVFEYENMTLERIVLCLENWYGVGFTYDSPQIGRRKFTGIFHKGQSLDDILGVIEKTTNIKFSIADDKIEITTR